MFSLLDSIIGDGFHASARERTTAAAPVILSEQHDVTAINFVAGLSDPGEMIRCGHRPELRRLAGEADDVYANRIRPLVMALPQKERDIIMGAAIKRAGYDLSNGRVNVMIAGVHSWAQLGVNVSEATGSEHAIVLSGTDFEVDKVQLQYFWEGQFRTGKTVYALVRKDTGKMLGHAGDRYKVIQNRQAFAFVDSLLGEFGARYATAGSLHGGERVFMQVEMPRQAFEVVRGDEVKPYVLFTNPHNGRGAAQVFATEKRAVCANTTRQAIRDAKGKEQNMSIRHSGDIRAKVADARKALGLAVKGFEEFKHTAETLVRSKMADPLPYFNATLDDVCDITAAEAKQGADALAAAVDVTTVAERVKLAAKFEKQIEARKSVLDDIIERYHGPANGVNGIRGTAWAAVNAVTEHANHARETRKIGDEEARNSRRFDSVVNGDADRLNQSAFATARAMAV